MHSQFAQALLYLLEAAGLAWMIVDINTRELGPPVLTPEEILRQPGVKRDLAVMARLQADPTSPTR